MILKEGYIIDYISGKEVKASPEEVEAVQVFSKQLVEDYGYPKNLIKTHSQYKVKARPSDKSGKYPVDIAIFENENFSENNIYIIVECKKNNRKDGKSQLEDYLRLSKAKLGVWFNGEERLFLRKIESKGSVTFKPIPNIPRYTERLEDIGLFKRKDLVNATNLKIIFKTIRKYLAGNYTGATRDEELARELINLIFCKIYDEKFTRPEDKVSFRVGLDEKPELIKSRINKIFDSVKHKYPEIINVSDEIKLDNEAITYVVGELQNYCLINAERDVIAEAFETFISGALKGGQGQFFTPRNIVKLLVEITNPLSNEQVIDPACGSGGFLIESLKHQWKNLEDKAKEYNWSDLALNEEKMAVAIKNIKGIEKDRFLSKVTKAYMVLMGDGKGGIFCDDSLEKPEFWNDETRQNIKLNQFDVLLANPPFGKEIKITGEDKLSQYNLAYKWKKTEGKYNKTSNIKKEDAPQILFVERSLQLLKNGGRMAIILPETYFHAPKSGYVIQYLLKNNNLQWLVDLPHNTFRPYNNAKCVAVVVQKNKPQQKNINLAVIEEMGHDHQGKDIFRWNYETKKIDRDKIWDDVPLIIEEIKNNTIKKYTFKVSKEKMFNSNIFVPRYFWQNKIKEIEQIALKGDMQLISIKQLINEGIIKAFDGHGSPPAEYKGRGDIPYIRVKDIVNWDVYKDPTSHIPKEIYLQKKGKSKDLHSQDILYVRRGSYRIGSVAMVSEYDTEVLLTREILVLRVLAENNKYGINPHYLLYLLSHSLTHLQAKNKILIETTLPNIANRWSELLLPISNNKKEREHITKKIKEIMEYKWKAIKKLNEIKNELGYLIT